MSVFLSHVLASVDSLKTVFPQSKRSNAQDNPRRPRLQTLTLVPVRCALDRIPGKPRALSSGRRVSAQEVVKPENQW